MGSDPLLEPASCGHSRNCMFGNFHAGFIFQDSDCCLTKITFKFLKVSRAISL